MWVLDQVRKERGFGQDLGLGADGTVQRSVTLWIVRAAVTIRCPDETFRPQGEVNVERERVFEPPRQVAPKGCELGFWNASSNVSHRFGVRHPASLPQAFFFFIGQVELMGATAT